jgi:hypothetical protein
MSLPDALQHTLKSLLPSKSYVAFRKLWRHFLRVKREGLLTAYQRRRLWPKILDTPPVYTNRVDRESELTVHMMCYQSDYLSALWALKSFYYYSKKRLPLALHIQGESTPDLERHLKTHFPNARLILQSEADQAVEPYLREHNCPRLLDFRRMIPTIQKLTDFLIMGESKKILVLDADILFFSYPEELVDIHPTADRSILFQRDYMDSYTISSAQAISDFGIDLRPEINVGIVRLSRDLINLTKCEEYLMHPEFAQFEGHTEQTLWALEASRNHAVAYLPSTYAVTLDDSVDCSQLKARHYAGPSRGLLTREGIPFLIRSGFLRSLDWPRSRETAEAD